MAQAELDAAAAAPVAWPASAGWAFTVMVDTEEEFDWSAPFSRSATSTTAIAALPAAHARFAAAGVPLTFLIDYPVATDPQAVDTLRSLVTPGGSAIGAQLHPWVNPPFEEEPGPRNSFLGNLPEPLQRAKLAALTAAIRAAFGATPRVFRAGRYGLGPATLRLIAEQGYRIDTSVRPGFDYRNLGGPDHSRAGNAPYRAVTGAPLIELPLTTLYTGAWRRGGGAAYRRLAAIPGARAMASRLGLFSRITLSPEAMPVDEVLVALQRTVATEPPGLLVFSFHSPSLVPGHTPYVRDADDLARFFAWWDQVLALLDRLGVRAVGEATLVEALAGGPATIADAMGLARRGDAPLGSGAATGGL